ncbi:MAG: hypothetical protein KDD19_28665 [Phaeodactylibacter sp.]|nr:hypothetical protein [Phaeodactylibacter sp.]MCB9048228.1 hypothetical protein [Lewinellaceae bacterium]
MKPLMPLLKCIVSIGAFATLALLLLGSLPALATLMENLQYHFYELLSATANPYAFI